MQDILEQEQADEQDENEQEDNNADQEEFGDQDAVEDDPDDDEAALADLAEVLKVTARRLQSLSLSSWGASLLMGLLTKLPRSSRLPQIAWHAVKKATGRAIHNVP